ncbi:cytochrome o ubiquinol oxidase subunit IV [Paracoccus sp. PAMC 22219]|uniref:cytochrome o ubiquinol oxidase subunit IV n=1 Tax=Paracoccus sp. PAMC 22219 TaxID=1569209 RepID=UPI000A49505B|nr:cytochrome o ubiquinol oxidase subunit IV [Paracoccus sp. PAMC 22219]
MADTAHAKTAAHVHHPDGHDHGTYRSYAIGFILSVILTAIPFGLVMMGGLESRLLTAGIVIGSAAIQVLVHMVYFLHMNGRSDEGWTMMALIFTVVVVVIILAGSLWVMHNMNANMMPQMNHDGMPQLSGFGT